MATLVSSNNKPFLTHRIHRPHNIFSGLTVERTATPTFLFPPPLTLLYLSLFSQTITLSLSPFLIPFKLPVSLFFPFSILITLHYSPYFPVFPCSYTCILFSLYFLPSLSLFISFFPYFFSLFIVFFLSHPLSYYLSLLSTSLFFFVYSSILSLFFPWHAHYNRLTLLKLCKK